MSLQSVNSSTVAKPPALGCCGILIEPYKEGGRRLAKGFCKAPAGNPISFCQRIVQVIAGISLLIPVINIVIYVAMRAFCSAPIKGQETISESKKKTETIEQITIKKPVTKPNPPVSVSTSESKKPGTKPKPPTPVITPEPIKPVIDPEDILGKDELDNKHLVDPLTQIQENIIFQGKINKAVDAANQAVQKIPKEDIQKDILHFISQVRLNALNLLNEQKDPEIFKAILETIEWELKCIVEQSKDLCKCYEDPSYICPTVDAIYEDAHAISTAIKDWQKKIASCFISSTLPQQAFAELLEEGKKAGFLNKRSAVFFGGNIFHHLAKITNKASQILECIPKLINAGIDLSLQDFWGNTALIWAIANGHNEKAMKIIQSSNSGPSFDVQCFNQKNTALHLAIAKGYKNVTFDGDPVAVSNLQLVEAIIAKKANVNLKNKDGNTPLHLACARRNVPMIRALLKAGADRTLKNNEGKLPQDLLEIDHANAEKILRQTTCAFLLDKAEHASSLKDAKALFGL